jgi:hypothetical protein
MTTEQTKPSGGWSPPDHRHWPPYPPAVMTLNARSARAQASVHPSMDPNYKGKSLKPKP